MQDIKDRFIELLRSSGRVENCDAFIDKLDKVGFFDAPASTKFHLSDKGGLLRHSVNVCEAALNIRESLNSLDPSLKDRLPIGSVILCSLLHDVCKADVYREVQKWRKDADNKWEQYNTFETDYSHCPLGHGEKSVIRLLSWGQKLTLDEALAIRWHMAAWELPFQSHETTGNLNAARERSPLVTLLQCADMLASGILETETSNN